MKNVLIVNQSAELYGADKAILELIENYPAGYNPIVVLHEEGPLKELLERKGIEVIKCSVIKVKRGILKPGFFLKLPFEVFKSFRLIRKQLNGRKIDLIHSNATSVFIGAFYASTFRIKHLWHVHEIIEKPKKIAYAYPRIINFFSSLVVFNSHATEKHFVTIYPKIKLKSVVIYNGMERKISEISILDKNKIRSEIFQTHDANIVITLIGRISAIKGQRLLLQSFSECIRTNNNIHLVFIGSYVLGKSEYYDSLIADIDAYNLKNNVTIVDFKENIWPFYDASDIIIIPSTEPESFGLVAIEGMLSNKPVIVSKIGALEEIIIDGESGLLFIANDKIDLKNKINLLIQNSELRTRLAKNGYDRVVKNFSTSTFVEKFKTAYDSLVNNDL